MEKLKLKANAQTSQRRRYFFESDRAYTDLADAYEKQVMLIEKGKLAIDKESKWKMNQSGTWVDELGHTWWIDGNVSRDTISASN